MEFPYQATGKTGPQLYFLHANGYPPDCYQPLLAKLADHHQVISFIQRPLWPGSQPQAIDDWIPLTKDFLDFLESLRSSQVIAIGHSMGGTAALRAAILQPDKFKGLVLLDPVLYPPRVILLWRIIRILGLSYQAHPLIRTTSHRREYYADMQKLFSSYRRKPVFARLDDSALQAYVKGITCPAGQGFKLCYPVEWEMRIYATGIWRDMDIWRNLPKVNLPILIIRGEETSIFWTSTAQKVIRLVPQARLVTVPRSSHLVPLEYPAQVATSILEFIKELE